MPQEKKIFIGDTGVVFKVFSNTDLSTATSISFEVKKQNGQLVNWVARVDSTNSFYATYTTLESDLDVAGEWLLSLQVVFPGPISVKGASAKFNVYEQFKDI